MFGVAKDAFSQCQRCLKARRKLAFRVSVWHVLWCERWLTAIAGIISGGNIPQKGRLGALVRAKSRHKFLTKNQDNGGVMLNVGCGMLNESFGCRAWHVQSERSVKI